MVYYLARTKELSKAYSDLTGRFHIQPSQGNNYILVAFHPDVNVILVQIIKDRTKEVILKAWIILNTCFKTVGIKLKT